MLPKSNLNFKPCCGIQNPRKFCLWKPESWVKESGIEIKESGIPITIGIQNSTVLQKNTGIQNLESGIHSVESRIQDCAGLFPYKGWRMSMYNYIHTEIYSLKSYDVNFLITWIFEPQALSSTNYHLNVYFKGQCHCWEGHFVYRCQFSLGPGSAVGKKEKKIGEQSEPRGSLRRGKCGAALSPSPGHRSARFLRRYFSYLTPFFAFFSHCGAWSRANDSYTMTLEKLPLNDKIIALCLQHIIVNYKQQKWTLKNC